MKRSAPIWMTLAAVIAAGDVAITLGQARPQQQPQPAMAKTHLKAGDMAPDFKLKDQNGKSVRLSKFRGKKNVVLAFYVLAFTGG